MIARDVEADAASDDEYPPSLPSSFLQVLSFSGARHLLLDDHPADVPHDYLALIAARQLRPEALRLHFDFSGPYESFCQPSFCSPLPDMRTLRQLIVGYSAEMDYRHSASSAPCR